MKEISSQVRFNGHMLTDIIKVNVGFTIGLGTARENKLQTVGNSDGQIQLIDSRYDSKTISIPFTLPYESMGKKRELSAMLNVREPAQLWFSSEPDMYYMALPVSTSLTEEWDIGSGTLEFICIDPFAHAMTPKTFDAVGDTITIENKGTMPTPVSFDIQNQSDNGFVGLVNKDAIIQIGNPDEIDGYDYSNAEVRLFNSFESANELSQWQLNKVQPTYYKPKTLGGGFGVKKGTNGDWCLYPTGFNKGNSKTMWYGPSFYRDFAPNSKGEATADNFRMMTVIQSKSARLNDIGVHELTVLDANKKAICGFYFRKLNWGTHDMQLYMFVGDTIVQKWEGPTAWLMRDYLGSIVIEKVGNDFTFTLRNTTNKSYSVCHYHDEKIGALKAKGVVYWTAVAGQMDGLDMQLFVVQVKETVSGWRDVKNMFDMTDKISIDCTDRTVVPYLNSAKVLDIMDIGSRPIMAPPGDSTITIVTSTFASPLKVTARIRERYL